MNSILPKINCKWKFLRERSDNSWFKEERHTSLDSYLNDFLYSDDWVFNSVIDKQTLKSRNNNIYIRRFRPDARSEKLNYVIEFDGIQHYTDMRVVINDSIKDKWYMDLGYKIVRIPYFIQLSKENIQYLFNICVNKEYCPLHYSFYDSENTMNGLAIAPCSMCFAGLQKFNNEYSLLPDKTKFYIKRDLELVAKTNNLSFNDVWPLSNL